MGDTTFVTGVGLQDYIAHADWEWMNSTIELEVQAKLIHDQTSSSISPGIDASYRYGESHYLVAQYAVMQAAGYKKWRDFFYDYWGAHLGLEKAKIIKYGGFTEAENFFAPAHDQCVAYGFYEENREGTADVLNPDGGSQTIISPCAYSRFLTEYTRQGTYWVTGGEMDKQQADTGAMWGAYGNYGLGHWVYDDGVYNIWHSVGYAGFTPITSTLANHDKFWIIVNVYEPYNGAVSALKFIHADYTWENTGVQLMRSLFEGPNKPAVTTQYCSTTAPTDWATYDAQWEPETYTEETR